MARIIMQARTGARACEAARLDAVFRSVDDIGGVAEIPDGRDLVRRPVEQHEIFRPPAGLTPGLLGIEYQDGRTALDQARHQVPIRYLGVIAEMAGDLGLAAHPCLVQE